MYLIFQVLKTNCFCSIPYTRPPLPNFTNSESIAQVAIGIHVLRSLLYSVVEADLVDIPISSDTVNGKL